MDKHLLEGIEDRLEGFPEEKIPDLINYIDAVKQIDKADIEKPINTFSQEYFPEAGP